MSAAPSQEGRLLAGFHLLPPPPVVTRRKCRGPDPELCAKLSSLECEAARIQEIYDNARATLNYLHDSVVSLEEQANLLCCADIAGGDPIRSDIDAISHQIDAMRQVIDCRPDNSYTAMYPMYNQPDSEGQAQLPLPVPVTHSPTHDSQQPDQQMTLASRDSTNDSPSNTDSKAIEWLREYAPKYNDKRPDQPDGKKQTAMHIAAEHGALSVLRYLVEHKSSVNKQDADGLTPIMVAARRGHVDSVAFLIENGAKLRGVSKRKEDLLYFAAVSGSAELMRLLTQSGAVSQGCAKNGYSAVHIAAERGNNEILDVLLADGLDFNLLVSSADPPIMLAALNDKPQTVQWMISNGVAPDTTNNDGDTALHRAAEGNSPESVRVLCDAGASVNIGNNEGDNPARIAMSNDNFEALDALMGYGASIPRGRLSGHISLVEACRAGLKNIVLYFIQHHRVDQYDENGDTPLCAAASTGQIEIMQLLLSKGAGVNLQSKSGFTPLQTAQRNGFQHAADWLIQHGADLI